MGLGKNNTNLTKLAELTTRVPPVSYLIERAEKVGTRKSYISPDIIPFLVYKEPNKKI